MEDKLQVALSLTLKAMDGVNYADNRNAVTKCGKSVADLFNSILKGLDLPDESIPGYRPKDEVDQELRQMGIDPETGKPLR